MKNLKKHICALFIMLALSCCSATVAPSVIAPITAEAATVKINKKKLTLDKGKTFQLKVTGTKKKVTWKSSKPSVAKVSSKGKVTAKKAGTAKITAKVSGKKYTCTVKVVEKPKVVKFSASTTDLTINQSGSVYITYKTNIEGNVLYHVGDTSICTCKWAKDWEGDKIRLDITGWKSGQTYITVTNSLSSNTIKINVNVNLNARNVTLNAEEKSLYVDDEFKLTAAVSPSYVRDQSVTWESSNPDVASVYATGTVHAWSEGTAIITATSKDGKAKASCTVHVSNIYANEVTLNITEKSLYVGDQFKLTAEVSPSNVKNKSVTWESSNPDVASVYAMGTVHAWSEGTAIITATSKDGKAKASCTVHVSKKYVEKITLSQSDVVLYIGDSLLLEAETYPSDADYSDTSLQWFSDNENIVSVTSYGRIEAISEGITTITVTNKSGTCRAQCTVRVNNPINIQMPSLPKIISEYGYGNRLSKVCTVTNVRFDVEKVGNHYSGKLYIDGKKDFDSAGSNISSYCHVGYKLYKGDAVAASGTILINPISVGDKFVDCHDYLYNLSMGNYRLELLDVR